MSWSPTVSDGHPATLSEAVGQALGTASVCWENPAGAGVFDTALCAQVYEGLMAYLADWAADTIRRANEASEGKAEAALKEWKDLAYEQYALLCNSRTDGHSTDVQWQQAFERLKTRFHTDLGVQPGEAE